MSKINRRKKPAGKQKNLMKIIIFFGPPGVGKGTQAILLAQKLGFKHISTGEVIRQEIAHQTDLGKQVQDIIKSGQLAPDELLLQIMEKFFESNKNSSGVVLDGFPRTIKQAELLESLLSKRGLNELQVINLTAEEGELIKRLLKRGQEQRRLDDTQEVIKNRLEVYEMQTLPVLSFYESRGIVKNVEGIGKIEEIHETILKSLS
ncbi:MAG: adenylate kinase [archaeon]